MGQNKIVGIKKNVNDNELKNWIIALLLALVLLFLLSLASCTNTQNSAQNNSLVNQNSPSRSGNDIKLIGDEFTLVKSPRNPTFAFSSNNKQLSIALSRDGRITDVDLNNEKISTGKDGGFVVADSSDNDTYFYLTGSIENDKFSTLMRRLVFLSKYEGNEKSVHVTGKIKSEAIEAYQINLSYRLPVNLEGWEIKQESNYVEFSKDNKVIGIKDLTGSGTFHYSEASGAYVDYELVFLPQRKINDFEFEIYTK